MATSDETGSCDVTIETALLWDTSTLRSCLNIESNVTDIIVTIFVNQ